MNLQAGEGVTKARFWRHERDRDDIFPGHSAELAGNGHFSEQRPIRH